MTQTPVPFFDLTRQFSSMESEVFEAVMPLFRSQQFILGEAVSSFEEAFAKKLGLGRAVGVSSGTDALVIGLLASGLKPGQGVLVPSFTFFATAGAVVLAGGVPVFVDVDPVSYLMTPEIVEDFFRRETVVNSHGGLRTRRGEIPVAGILPVHLYGRMVDMEVLSSVARRHGLFVVEDACQSVGASFRGRPPGTFSQAVAYSFFPTKNLGAAGDAGMITASDPAIVEHCLRLRVHGSRRRYEHEEMGMNARLDALQARVLSVKLPRLEGWTRRRQELAERYNEAFSGLPGVVVPLDPDRAGGHVYHQYTLRVSGEGRRDRLRAALTDRSIGSEVYYPIPLHRQKAFSDNPTIHGPLAVSEALSREVVSLPVFPELTDLEQERVIGAVRDLLSS
ncbi:MAG: DegT/DnrJ/EryC1/StrS family aminotransferase [Leptospirillia bacterium]